MSSNQTQGYSPGDEAVLRLLEYQPEHEHQSQSQPQPQPQPEHQPQPGYQPQPGHQPQPRYQLPPLQPKYQLPPLQPGFQGHNARGVKRGFSSESEHEPSTRQRTSESVVKGSPLRCLPAVNPPAHVQKGTILPWNIVFSLAPFHPTNGHYNYWANLFLVDGNKHISDPERKKNRTLVASTTERGDRFQIIADMRQNPETSYLVFKPDIPMNQDPGEYKFEMELRGMDPAGEYLFGAVESAPFRILKGAVDYSKFKRKLLVHTALGSSVLIVELIVSKKAHDVLGLLYYKDWLRPLKTDPPQW